MPTRIDRFERGDSKVTEMEGRMTPEEFLQRHEAGLHEHPKNAERCVMGRELDEVIAMARAAERERCAKIAEFEHCGCKDEDCKQCAADFRGVKIAEEIRSGK